MKTLILGGYGNFGARVCRALANDPKIQLLVGGRDRQRAERLASELGGTARGIAVNLHEADFASKLREHEVELLIHTAGPFQQQAYSVAMAAAEARCHYVDLADGRRFVCDFASKLHAAFLAAGRVAVCGASTVPALSSAVIDHICADWQRIDTIDICIAPAQTAPRGKATMEAVLSYCGEPIEVWMDGTWQTRLGWADPTQVEFARLKPRRGALCDVPDLELFPKRYGVQDRVMFRAALEVGLTQKFFALLAQLRSRGVIPQPARLGGFLSSTAPILDFLGTSLGGMVIQATGIDKLGDVAGKSWHISADHDHGPEIPCMAAILLARRMAAGADLPLGAHACVSLLNLADFQPEFDRWKMTCEVRNESVAAK